MKVKVRTPSGKISIHSRKDRVETAKCANCRAELHGMPNLHSSRLRKLSKSERRPGRPYGGYLCSNCSREIFRKMSRSV